MDDAAVRVPRAHRQRQMSEAGELRVETVNVFTNPYGAVVDPDHLTRRFRHLVGQLL